MRASEEVYRLRNQAGAEEYAGRNVKITGVLDAKTNTIDNSSIEAAPVGKPAVHVSHAAAVEAH